MKKIRFTYPTVSIGPYVVIEIGVRRGWRVGCCPSLMRHILAFFNGGKWDLEMKAYHFPHDEARLHFLWLGEAWLFNSTEEIDDIPF